MNPELLTFLNAKVQQFSVSPGGIPNLTSEDISHLIGKIQAEAKDKEMAKLACDYVVLKIAGTGDQRKLAEGLRRQIWKFKEKELWRVPKKDFMLDLCILALSESLDAKICPDCKGREGGIIKGRYVICGPCGGTGKRKIYDKDRANLLKVSRPSWSDTWGPRYRQICMIIDRWEDIFHTGIARYSR